MSQDKPSPFNKAGIEQEQVKQEQLEDEPISSAEPSAIQEFAHSIMGICTLESDDKLSSKEAYQQIKDHWKELKKSIKKHKNKDKH